MTARDAGPTPDERPVSGGHTWPCPMFYVGNRDQPKLGRPCTCGATTRDTASTPEVDALAEVVADHELLSGSTAQKSRTRKVRSHTESGFACRCGAVEVQVWDTTYSALHAAHLANVIRAAGWVRGE